MADQNQQIQSQINTLNDQVAAGNAAGYGVGGQYAGQPIPQNILTAATPDQNAPTTPTSGAGIDDTTFLGYLNNMNTVGQQNNQLVQQKNLISKALFDQPLTTQELQSLPPDVAALVQGGNQDQMKLQLQVINDSLQGRNQSVASSLSFLTTGYENAQQAYQTSMTNILNYSRYLGAKPSDVLKAAYPQIYNSMTDAQKASFTALDNEVTGTPTSGVNGADLSTYSTDPNYSSKVSTIQQQLPMINSASDIQSYIQSNFPSSPITGDDIMSAATQYGVDPSLMTAQLQQESQMGTTGESPSNNNPAGLKYVGQAGVVQGTAAPEGGYYAKFPTLQDGINAEAQWISNHPSESSSVQSWVDNINNGKATISQVPANLKTKVSQALDSATQSSASQPSNLNDWISSLTPAQQNDLKSQASASGKYNQEVLGNVYGIATGLQPPTITGSMGAFSSYIKAGLSAVGFNMVDATNEWTATQKYIASANSPTQVKLKQAITSVQQGIGQLKSDAAKWNAGGFAPLNSANMIAALSGAYGQDAQSIAADFQQQSTIIQDELGQTFMGGNSPTDKALGLAGKVFDTSWSDTTLNSALDQLDTNLGFRMNAINTVQVGGLGGDASNPYSPSSSGVSSSSGTTPSGISYTITP
jgi:hypothetical protein